MTELERVLDLGLSIYPVTDETPAPNPQKDENDRFVVKNKITTTGPWTSSEVLSLVLNYLDGGHLWRATSDLYNRRPSHADSDSYPPAPRQPETSS